MLGGGRVEREGIQGGWGAFVVLRLQQMILDGDGGEGGCCKEAEVIVEI
ncbi:hypothetical protein Acr_00g0061600 [Actinidia rufa]|uniref:Uncharacterized protein n=1 Tax=Actinidia rufa TaxID=165716 RepID=A0A7J0DNR4_9ERIC|nr:hypothetical protein Acr_00g0061600 [Actinidia rufa]